jgi:arginyl-tRNA synthetase
MVLAKGAGTNPRALAEAIKPKLEALPAVTSVEIAGPGFINLRCPRRLARRAARRSSRRRALRPVDIGATSGSTSNMSRPTRPGRCTWAIAAARWSAMRWRGCSRRRAFRSPRNIMSTTPAAQVDTLARSVHLRYREALGEDIGEIPEGCTRATI